jgi:AcrR family transcriptional regulator
MSIDGTTQGGTGEAIEWAALEVFYIKGYHGASIRAIAAAAGVGISTLFHHYPTKSAILERILDRAVDAMQADLDEATEGIVDPIERLSAAVRALVVAHCQRQSQSFVAQSELRSLTDPAAREIRRKRRLVQGVFDDAIAAGLESGEMTCEHPREVSRAIVSMGTMVATWYHAGHGMTPQEVTEIYVAMALKLVAADVAHPAAVRL